MKKIKLLILLLSVTFIGCKTVQNVPLITETKIIEKLVPVTISPDSALVKALFECDSSNNVIMRSLQESKTSDVDSDYSFDQGLFSYKTITVHDTVYVPVKEKSVIKEVAVKVPVIEYKLNWFQRIFYYSGFLLWIVVIVYILRRFYFKRK